MSQPPQDGSPGQQPPQGQGRPPQQGPQGYPPQQAFGPQQGRPPQGPPPGYPPQGYPQQPYGGGPGQPYPQQGYPPQPYGPQPGPYGQPPQQPKKKRTGLFVLIGAGALALILAVVAVAVNLGGRSETAGGGTTGGGSSGGPSAAGATASDAVNGYLQAVAKGDAQGALAYAADPSSVDGTYMTPEVLAVSTKLAPMTAISVPPVTDPDASAVDVTYKLGSTDVSASIDVIKIDDTWKLPAVGTEIDPLSVKDDNIPMIMNGVKITKQTFIALPGVYRFTTGQRNFDYGKHPDLVVKFPGDAPDVTGLAPGVSSKGKDSGLSALRKSWSSCLKSRDAKPGGCPNRWNNSAYKFRNGTVRWSRKGSDPVKKPTTSTYSNYSIYQVKIDLALRGTCSSGGRTGTCTGTLTGGRAIARAEYSADKVKISWQT